MYGNIPYVMTRKAAIMWLNGARTFVDISKESVDFFSEAGSIEFVLLPGPTPSDLSFQLASVAGFP
jgi:hypothetical protein